MKMNLAMKKNINMWFSSSRMFVQAFCKTLASLYLAVTEKKKRNQRLRRKTFYCEDTKNVLSACILEGGKIALNKALFHLHSMFLKYLQHTVE